MIIRTLEHRTQSDYVPFKTILQDCGEPRRSSLLGCSRFLHWIKSVESDRDTYNTGDEASGSLGVPDIVQNLHQPPR